MKNFISILIVLIVFLSINFAEAQQVFINEIMASNGFTIPDEDGDYSDWIEIFNQEETNIDLGGFGLSDDINALYKWVLPSFSIASKDHLLIFASDKNRTDYIKHWETVIDWGDDWKYKLGTSEPPVNWKNLEFDDQLWLTGPSGFGYGDGDDSTIVPAVNSVYVRKIFSVDNMNDIKMAVLHVDFDDAFVAYINGVEIARENIGTVNIPPAYNQSATNYTEPLIVFGGLPKTYIIQNFQSLLQNGNNVIAIQVHNYGTGSSDLTLIPFLTLGMDVVPPNPHGTNPILVLPNKFLHTNFKLSANGETLVLTNPQNIIADQVTFSNISTDVSYGRQPDGSNNWFLFSTATPGDSNTTQGFSGTTMDPSVSINGGFYSGSVSINITPGTVNDVIHYTLDGSEPVESSPVYSNPIQINSTKVLKAKSFKTGFLPSKTLTHTYFINFSTALTVVSLSTDPKNLFDEEYGIYAMGDSAEPSFPYFGANFWKDWERPAHIELYEPNGDNAFGIDMGIKIFGGWSRGNAQKSFALFARGQYGYNSLNYKLFDELPFIEYESFVLRNSGNDWTSTMLRDAFMTSLVDGIDIDKQNYRPAILFINGEYWGIQNIREKVNEHFIAQHHKVDPDSVDILEYFGQLVNGDSTDYMALHSFIENNSMSVPENYEYVKTKMDVDNFIRYFVAQIYFDNRDWPGSNIKYWRKSGTGKWRWILFDTDFGYGIWDSNAFQYNTLEFALEPNGPGWPNPPWSTLFLRKLLLNQSFRNDFINCFADLSNTVFKPSEVINKINSIASKIEPEITRHGQRWNQFDLTQWQQNIQVIRNFANQRIPFMRNHFTQKFGLGSLSAVYISLSDTSKGTVKLNSLLLKTPSWYGNYFNGIPITIIAQPKRGYRFVKWEGTMQSTQDTVIITISGNTVLNAVFELDTGYSIPKVVINEINYNSSLTFNPQDWIEFYNNSDTSVNISGWIFRDSEEIHNYSIPAGTILGPRGFIVLCSDDTLFHPLFPDVTNYIGNFDFGLSGGGELLMLLDQNLNVIDSLTYDDAAPWPEEADGNGPTLALINPDYDNHLPQNWAASNGYGTPGSVNDVFVNVPENRDLITDEYSLLQNFPNPFNPVTAIKYSIPKTSFVSLKVYDVLGHEVKTLVEELKNPGTYQVIFEGTGLSSGVYFYRIKAENFINTKKLILLK
ncbi:MAG: CotH kinase family protein [Ignavibacterium sp.]|nr:CotH kinase family protein [Ignavibacterium sp.]